jgi:rubrerythrin
MIKMMRSISSECRENKKYSLWARKSDEQEYSETILLFFARAGSLNNISFFFNIIGLEGYKL